jgi:hypothetical protein
MNNPKCRTATITLLVLFAQWGFGAFYEARGTGPGTGLQWRRNKYGGTIEVTATRSGPHLFRAQQELEAVSDRLDAIRTIYPHVVWSTLRWEDGRMEIMARAETAIYGNVATLSIRRLFPGRSSAGTGIQQLKHVPAHGFKWRVRMLLVDKLRKGGETPQKPNPTEKPAP